MKARTRHLGAIVFFVVIAVACGHSSDDTSADAGTVFVKPSGPLAGPFTAASVTAAEELLAQNGIATVSSESSNQPLLPVTHANGIRFTEIQVRNMALTAADGGGIVGSTLDAVTPMPSGAPAFSYLLAAWVKQGSTGAATAMSTLMGTRDWTQAPLVEFPTIALPLFVADVLRVLPDPPPGSGGIASTPCSTVSNFIQNVINNVFMTLELNAPAGTGVVSTVGGFLVGIWNGALALAQAALQAAISSITAPILHAIETAAGTALVISEVVSYITPWSLNVSADPDSVTAGSGGTVTGKVDTGIAGPDYPPAVEDCAMALGVTLPSVNGAMASAVWSLTSPISATGDTSVTLDGKGSSTLGFETSPSEDQAGSCGATETPPPQVGTATLTVTRPGIDGLEMLVDTIVTNGFGVAGNIIGPAIQAVLEPMVAKIEAALPQLADVTGTGYVTVNEPPTGGGDCPGGGGSGGSGGASSDDDGGPKARYCYAVQDGYPFSCSTITGVAYSTVFRSCSDLGQTQVTSCPSVHTGGGVCVEGSTVTVSYYPCQGSQCPLTEAGAPDPAEYAATLPQICEALGGKWVEE